MLPGCADAVTLLPVCASVTVVLPVCASAVTGLSAEGAAAVQRLCAESSWGALLADEDAGIVAGDFCVCLSEPVDMLGSE